MTKFWTPTCQKIFFTESYLYFNNRSLTPKLDEETETETGR